MCDVSPYRDDYESIKNVPIVNAATAWQSTLTGQIYILVINECIWMGDNMDHTLINPNQLRHFGTKVQDNPTLEEPLSIITEDKEFCMDLCMHGTICYADTFVPSEAELNSCPHIILTSNHPWDTLHVTFRKSRKTLDELVGGMQNVSVINSTRTKNDFEDDSIFSLEKINRSVAAMRTMTTNPKSEKLLRSEIDPGTSDVSITNTFESSDRHSDVTPQALSEMWGISIATAAKTLKRTSQRFLRSAILPLSRRYRVDRMFHRKTLSGDWSTDTMDARLKSLEGNKFAQVFANKAYFSRIYPMDSKGKAGNALRLFCQEFGVPESLTFDGSKEQNGKHTEFMKQIRTHNINYHVSEPGQHNQNPVEGVMRELRRKWYRIIIRKRISREL